MYTFHCVCACRYIPHSILLLHFANRTCDYIYFRKQFFLLKNNEDIWKQILYLAKRVRYIKQELFSLQFFFFFTFSREQTERERESSNLSMQRILVLKLYIYIIQSLLLLFKNTHSTLTIITIIRRKKINCAPLFCNVIYKESEIKKKSNPGQ